jgi:hypothetical protein
MTVESKKYVIDSGIFEATQWSKPGDHPEVKRVAEALNLEPPYQYYVDTVNGPLLVDPGDWITVDYKGNVSRVRAREFPIRYQPL